MITRTDDKLADAARTLELTVIADDSAVPADVARAIRNWLGRGPGHAASLVSTSAAVVADVKRLLSMGAGERQETEVATTTVWDLRAAAAFVADRGRLLALRVAEPVRFAELLCAATAPLERQAA